MDSCKYFPLTVPRWNIKLYMNGGFCVVRQFNLSGKEHRNTLIPFVVKLFLLKLISGKH
jgi:hypothetical protein